MEILLIRHGKPSGAVNPKLSASGFANWIREYNKSKIDPNNLPPKYLGCSLGEHFVVASDLARSIDSARLCVGKDPDLKLKELREMDIPRYKLPFFFRAYTWLFISRLCWFAGFSGKVESFKKAKTRAKTSANQLQELANTHGKVVFFGHGMLNKFIAKELKNLGWNGTSKGQKYWSVIKLQTKT
ncbi:histidine phosphatase family protein [Colwelliaceae bacterium 6471]